MKRIIEFGISESSRKDRLNPGWDRPDLENGQGEYLGIFRIGNKDVIITRVIDKRNRGKIRVNEISFDSYNDGGIVFYHNTSKSNGIKDLEEYLNSPQVIEALENGMDLEEVISKATNSYGPSRLKTLFESQFTKSTEPIVPEGYDFSTSEETWSKLEKEPVERMLIAGLSKDLFEELRETKRYAYGSLYSLIMRNRELEREVAELKRRNKELETQTKNDSFHI